MSPFFAAMRATAVEAEAPFYRAADMNMDNLIAMNTRECVGFDVPFTRLRYECVTYSGH